MGSGRGALIYIMQLLFAKKKTVGYFHSKDTSAFLSHLALACRTKTDCLIFSLCTYNLYNANQFTNYSKAKMKLKFIQVDEGSFIPCSRGFDTRTRVRGRAVERARNLQKWFGSKYPNSH